MWQGTDGPLVRPRRSVELPKWSATASVGLRGTGSTVSSAHPPLGIRLRSVSRRLGGAAEVDGVWQQPVQADHPAGPAICDGKWS